MPTIRGCELKLECPFWSITYQRSGVEMPRYIEKLSLTNDQPLQHLKYSNLSFLLKASLSSTNLVL